VLVDGRSPCGAYTGIASPFVEESGATKSGRVAEQLGAGGVALSICFACGVLGEGLDKALLKRNRTKFDACRDSLLGDLGMRPRYTIIMAGL
jgi:hypothetical protein